MLSSKIKQKVIYDCNYNIVPDPSFDYNAGIFPSDWFVSYFSFLNEPSLQKNLGEAFYQARFAYKLMKALHLTKAKYYGLVKFQILQYASIYEAILDYYLDKHYKDEIMTAYAEVLYSPVQATSNKTIIKHDGEDVFLCVKRIRKKPIKLIKIQSRTEFAVSKGIISDSMRDRICNLYDTRNNVHILKATQNKYVPNLSDAKKAYALMDDFVDEIKLYISSHN